VFSTDSRHTNGYKLCFSSRRLVVLFVRGRLHTGASQEKEEKKLAIDITRYIDDVLSLTNYNFGDFVVASLLSKPAIKDLLFNWEIYTPYAGAAGMLLHINRKIR
jgi:hypothetical protein